VSIASGIIDVVASTTSVSVEAVLLRRSYNHVLRVRIAARRVIALVNPIMVFGDFDSRQLERDAVGI